ncbi:MAG: thermonuclease family protein [Anaerolineaceae bacterium]|nr:thermonuclease family protein [Anaerolineaceae bacterium]
MNYRKNLFLITLGLSFFFIACKFLENNLSVNKGKQNNQVSATGIPTHENKPIYADYDCIPSPGDFEVGWATYIIDGDSIVAEINGKEYEIRYIGINTPEYYSSDRVAAEQATVENMGLVKGKKIYLFKDRSNTDKFHRLLRYVFTEDYFVNYELVKRGFAESKSYPPDISCQKLFQKDEK